MNIANKKNVLIGGIIGLILIIIELGIIINTYLTIKYTVEMSDDISKILNAVYSIVQTLSILIIVDILIITALFVWLAKK